MRQPKNGRQTLEPLPVFTAPIHTLIHLNRQSDIPIYRQISQELRTAIVSGDLPAGTRLPTERSLAKELGVNRTTVMNAYNELEYEGLIEGHVGRGTLVKRNYFKQENEYFDQETPSWLFGLADSEDVLLGQDARVLSDIFAQGNQQEFISLAQGAPASDMIPVDIFRSLLADGAPATLQRTLGYSPVEGLLSLRREIAQRMRQRGVEVDIQNILILSGSTQGIGLISRFLLNPGDEVVVEIPTYLGAIQTFRALGARVIGVPTDNDGMRVDLLETILTRRHPRLIYTLPTFHNPTGTVLAQERRRRLILLARRYQIPILEDDPYGELYFEGPAPQPLKALDQHGNVLYLSTYSKTLAPGLRVAWLAAPEPVIDRLALHKQIFDLNTNALGQWIIAEMLRHNLMDEYLVTLRGTYQKKRDLMLETIATSWPSTIRSTRPNGGFHLWCRLPHDLRARTLLREATQERVAFAIGEPFHVDGGGHHHLRLSFATPGENEIKAGIQRIGATIQRLTHRHSPTENEDLQSLEHLPLI